MAEDAVNVSGQACPPLQLPAAQVPYLKGPLRRPNTPLGKLRIPAGEKPASPPGTSLIGWLESACLQWSEAPAPQAAELCEAADLSAFWSAICG